MELSDECLRSAAAACQFSVLQSTSSRYGCLPRPGCSEVLLASLSSYSPLAVRRWPGCQRPLGSHQPLTLLAPGLPCENRTMKNTVVALAAVAVLCLVP